MEFDETLLQSLYDDIQSSLPYLRSVALSMVSGGISKYPIFVALRDEQDLDLGLPIIHRNETDTEWSIHASHLEDFVNKGVVHDDKVIDFRSAYKNPADYLCVFVAHDGANCFVFVPFDKYGIDRAQLN